MRRSLEEVRAAARLAVRHDLETAIAYPELGWSARRALATAFVHAITVATFSALMLVLAPYLSTMIGRDIPALAVMLDLDEPTTCLPVAHDWYLVKRVLIGYAGLVGLAVLGLLCYLGYFRCRAIVRAG
ncbi:hypothetical protein GD429_07185 [Burkholderia sp. BE17]|nr:hypothetical protein [Burkholderia sp. BE17]